MDKCAICPEVKGLRRYSILVDGVELRQSMWLCLDHSTRFLIRVGMVWGSLSKPDEEVFR